jgi:hypothetical protein
MLPMEQPYVYINDSIFWKHEEDMFTNLFQPPRASLLQPSHGNTQPYTMRYDTYPFE